MVVNYGGYVLSWMDQPRSVVKPFFVHPLINCDSEVVNLFYFISSSFLFDFLFYINGYSGNVFGL